MRKGLVLVLLLVSIMAIGMQGTVLAQEESPIDRFNEILERIQNFLSAIAVGVATVGYMIVGYLWILGRSDPERRGSARRAFIDVTIGVAVLFLANVLVDLVQYLVNG